MKITFKSWCRIYMIFLTVFGSVNIQAQTISKGEVNTRPIELYLQLANSIEQTGKPDEHLLKLYFEDPTVALFRQRPNFDSVRFVKNLISVYSGNREDPASLSGIEDHLLMEKYKQNERSIKRCVEYLKTKEMDALVKKRVRPYYVPGYNIDTIKIKYIYLFIDEGTGGMPGYVFNSALQTAYLPNDIIDIISSHEAYHTITNGLFMKKFGRSFANPSFSEAEKKFLWYMEIIAEEGIGDLIDKPVLTSRKTPLSVEYNKMRENESDRARRKIRLIDSLLSTGGITKDKLFDLNNFLENGGHIPGRYMAVQIKNKNFENYLKHTGNPFQFFFWYNEAVKDDSKMPRFSKKAIAVLKEMEERFNRE